MLILRELREEAGLTQKQLAEKINGMQRNVSNWEKGISQPDLQMLIRIADFFNVSLDELCGRERIEKTTVRETENSFYRKINSLTPEQQTAILQLIESFRR